MNSKTYKLPNGKKAVFEYDITGVGKITLECMDELMGMIADRPQGEWIPCSERLPKIGEHHISEPCLVYCKGGVYAFAELEENIFGQVGWNCERDDDYHEPIGEVTAWMPLPKPYGERKGNGKKK